MEGKTMKKAIAFGLAAVMMLGMVGCGSSSGSDSTGDAAGSDNAAASTTQTASSGSGSVYYLNFKPEQDEQWQELAQAYTDETGVEVTVQTAADGTYEQTLKSEMAKTEAPTLFQVNGPVGLANWSDYCYDLSDSAIYNHLQAKILHWKMKTEALQV
jgi:raffinose/stachyose/melibiose transport system substrate-binding protein